MMEPIGKSIVRVLKSSFYVESPIEFDMSCAMMRNKYFCFDDNVTGPRFQVVPQYKVGPYRADFVIEVWGKETMIKRIALECDGEEFHQDKEKDRVRDEYFKEQGIETIRFTGSEIYKSTDECIDRLIGYILGAIR